MQRTPTGTEQEALETSSNQASETGQFPSTSQPPFQEEDPYSLLAIRKRKYDTRWKQQRLIAWRQKFDLLHIIILYVSLGLLFMSVGGLCYYYAISYPTVIEVDYTNCKNATGSECFPSKFNKDEDPIDQTKSIKCTCIIQIRIDGQHLPEKGRSLILFFKLSGFHQNIRRYKKDVDWEQLGGNAISSDKTPIIPQCKLNARGGKPIFPCGKIASSYFSDRFKIFNSQGNPVSMNELKIPWNADIDRYKNPTSQQLSGKPIDQVFELPKAWHDNLRKEFLNGTGGYKWIQNPHFMVWMRAAALDTFRKKYAYIDLKDTGDYTIEIQYRFEVMSYKGTKKIVIAADPQDRPVDFFFFYCYIAVGAVCLLIGPIFLITSCVLNAFHKSSSSSKRSSQKASAANNPRNPPDDPQSSQNDMDPPTKNLSERPSVMSFKSSNQLKT